MSLSGEQKSGVLKCESQYLCFVPFGQELKGKSLNVRSETSPEGMSGTEDDYSHLLEWQKSKLVKLEENEKSRKSGDRSFPP